MPVLLLAVLSACAPAGPGGRPAPGEAAETASPGVDSGPGGRDSGAPAPDGRVRITELMADNEDTLVRADGTSPDWIELHNPGPGAVDLGGWTLADSDGVGTLDGVLEAGAFRVLWADGEGTASDSLPFALDADGESLALRDETGTLVDSVSFGAQREDVSWGRAQQTEREVLLTAGDTVRVGAPTAGWQAAGFDDAAWPSLPLPLGHASALGPAADLAPGAETVQSTDGYGRTGAQAVDGDPGTFSHTGDGDLAPWWELVLPEPAALTAVHIQNRADCCADRLYNLRVEARDDAGDVTWTSEVANPVAEGETPTSPGSTLSFAPAQPVAAARLRIAKTAVGGTRSTEWLSLAEVVVEGFAGSPHLGRIAGELDPAAGPWAVRAALPAVDRPPTRVHVAAWVDDTADLGLGEGATTELAGDGVSALVMDLDPAELDPDGGLLHVELRDADGADALLDLHVEAMWIETAAEPGVWFLDPTPGEPNGAGVSGFTAEVVADVPRGLLDAPTTVRLRSGTPGATLHYSLNGRPPEPGVSPAVAAAAGETPELVLDVQHTTLVRTRVTGPDLAPSPDQTFSYLLVDDILGQPAAPPGLPGTWAGSGQSAVAGDYEMDPEVVAATEADLRAGLRDIPLISIVMDPDDLWHPDTGIYIHTTQRGAAWERPTSVEFIEPTGESFQTHCGVRIHGWGWRPHSNTRKHSLRLEFRAEYGPGKLAWPLFPDAPVDRFDSIVLRSQGSRSWQDFRDPEQALYVRDAFARDTAFEMGKAGGHATYAHLFLNGLYWGLYMPVERPDADFAAERFGGEPEEWDAINRRTSTNEAIDGTLEAYEELLRRADADLTTAEGYDAVDEMLDIDDLIDYMLIHQYTTNRDGPEQFSHNNMRGVRRRLEGEGFRFFVWDMEYSLWGADEDLNIDVDVPGSASHVYARLRTSEPFRARYAARARMHLTGGGALTPDAALDRFERRCTQIERAVVGESARWGDTDRATPYTRDVEWAAERARLRDTYFPHRTDVLIQQLQAAGLY